MQAWYNKVVYVCNECSTYTGTCLLIPGKPVITLPPRSTEVVVGETISLYCTANALPAATITWLKGNSQITMNDGDNINITTTTSTVTGSLVATTTVLTITNAQLHDAGSYVCLAANIIGNISKEVPVSVFGKQITINENHILSHIAYDSYL